MDNLRANILAAPLALLAVAAGCSSQKEASVTAEKNKTPWGKTADGESVELYALTN